jgi:hypothetical protein
MALRDQPYLPLYVQDLLTDEKLIECSAQATGVYFRLICIMHKSEEYGKILLKQKDKQSTEPMINFAQKIARQMPYSFEVVMSSLKELVSEHVLSIDGDSLCQKRMIRDNLLSLSRAEAGRKGGKFAQAKIKANSKANTENENVIENETEDLNKKESFSKNDLSTAIFGKDPGGNQNKILSELLIAYRDWTEQDIKQAWEECYQHHSVTPSPPQEVWQWRQKLNSWISIKGKPKTGNNGTRTGNKETIRRADAVRTSSDFDPDGLFEGNIVR